MPAPPLSHGKSNANPPDIRLWALIREDYVTNGSDPMSQGFWALLCHRLGNARMDVKPRPLRAPLTLTYRLMAKATQVLGGIKLDYTVKVGRRVRIDHFGGIVIGARAIGDDVVIRQNTTLGVRSTADLNAKPTIGSGVNIGAGAVIVGDITIGDGASIGANCVVSFDVPPGARVRLGPPVVTVREPDPAP